MWVFQLLAEERIKESIQNGDFDNLEGKGQPLRELDDADGVPEELRMAFRMLKNAGCLPPELEERREIENAKQLLAQLTDEGERYRQMQKLNVLVMKANLRRSRPVCLEEQEAYYDKAVARISVRRTPR